MSEPAKLTPAATIVPRVFHCESGWCVTCNELGLALESIVRLAFWHTARPATSAEDKVGLAGDVSEAVQRVLSMIDVA